MKKIFNILKKTLKSSDSVAIFGHKSSDADCIGSALSLYYALKSLNKKVDVYVEDIPCNLKMLDKENIIKTSLLNNESYDLCISVDTASKSQLGKFGDFFVAFNNTIMIDHHASGDKYAKVCLVNGKIPSNCDFLLEIYKYLKIKIDKNIATCLFTGISGDTGRFLYSGNSLIPYNNAMYLIKQGADIDFVNTMLYKSTTKQTFNLTKKMYELCEIKKEYAFCVISNNELPKSNFTSGDFVNVMLNIEGIKVSALCIEKIKGVYSVSIRTRGNISACEIAKKLGGGGHFNAAGAKIESNNKTYVVNKIKSLIIDCLKEIYE